MSLSYKSLKQLAFGLSSVGQFLYVRACFSLMERHPSARPDAVSPGLFLQIAGCCVVSGWLIRRLSENKWPCAHSSPRIKHFLTTVAENFLPICFWMLVAGMVAVCLVSILRSIPH